MAAGAPAFTSTSQPVEGGRTEEGHAVFLLRHSRKLHLTLLCTSPLTEVVTWPHGRAENVGQLCDQLKIMGLITNRLCHSLSYLLGIIDPLGI